MTDLMSLAEKGAEHIIRHCGGVRTDESALIVCDNNTRALGELLSAAALRVTSKARLLEIQDLGMHGVEPPVIVAEAMQQADVIFGITAQSMAHTQARGAACKNGSRYLSLPDYTLELMGSEAVMVDYRVGAEKAKRVSQAFSDGSTVHVTTEAGTDIHLDIRGRVGNCCPGFVEGPGELGSPPDIEANVSPVETASKGIVIVDGSIPVPGFGLLSDNVIFHVADGGIVDFEGPAAVIDPLQALFKSIGTNKVYILAECGVGLNEKAELTGSMLTDEGALGTMHFGFGSNSTVGGTNDVGFHLDAVFRDASLKVDDQQILDKGTLVI